VHAAGYRSPPEADPAKVAKDTAATNNDPSSETLKRTYAFRHVEDLRQIMLQNGDGAKQVAVSSSAGQATTGQTRRIAGTP